MKENIIQLKSFELAKEIVFLHQIQTREKHEYMLSRQLLRSGTSVGANISEGTAGQSMKEESVTACQLPIKNPVKQNSG